MNSIVCIYFTFIYVNWLCVNLVTTLYELSDFLAEASFFKSTVYLSYLKYLSLVGSCFVFKKCYGGIKFLSNFCCNTHATKIHFFEPQKPRN